MMSVKRAVVKRTLLASVAVAALSVQSMTTGARAADQSAVPHLPTKTAIVPPALIYNWTGCYVGAHAGGGAVSDPFAGVAIEAGDNFLHGGGGVFGGQVGCNYQAGAAVVGLEGEAWSSLTNRARSEAAGAVRELADRNRWSADAAVRAGIAFDRALLYGKAGVAAGRFDFSDTAFSRSGRVTMPGVLFGAGLEYALAPNWSVKLEYDHIEYVGRTVRFDSPIIPDVSDVTESARADVIKAGINYRFGGLPLLAAPNATIDNALIAKAPVYKSLANPRIAATVAGWTGCYVGVHAGGGRLFDTVTSVQNGGGGLARRPARLQHSRRSVRPRSRGRGGVVWPDRPVPY
jgi:outer membrane immunogenic protein